MYAWLIWLIFPVLLGAAESSPSARELADAALVT